ncbi:MAG: hypothetical protein UFG06_13925 [Lachnospiraceae bacterium]|nr:hypothetical protein [Lachnospiraceae bacterium]
MAKAVLVIEMPENCNQCDSCIIGSVVFCGISGKKIEQEIMNESKTSEKCPLRELPKKKNYEKLSDTNPAKAWGNGWNACLDEIEGRKADE